MSKKPSIAGIILILLGLILLLRTFHIYVIGFFWPLVLIGLGLWVIYRRGRRQDRCAAGTAHAYRGADGVYTATFDDGKTKMEATMNTATGQASASTGENASICCSSLSTSE